MEENHNIDFELSLRALFSISEFYEFHKSYSIENKVKERNDLYILIEKFRSFLLNKREITNDEEIIFKHVIECAENESYKNSNEKIFITNKIKIPNEKFLIEFSKDFDEIKTEDLFFEEINKGKYKTITEYIHLHGVDGEKLTKLYEKYKNHNHPYIYDRIAEPILQAKNFSAGIPILKNSLKYALRNPNLFWHSINGVDACATSLYRIQFLLGQSGISELSKNITNFESKLLKLIYLYLSRYIYMSNDNIKSIDFYSNRARIVRDYNYQFMVIFGLGVNPDIQYISDKYLAYLTSNKYNLVGQPFIQYMWDSRKMYNHGSHIPNSTGGYREIEDATFLELVERGRIRSIIQSSKILTEFENYELNFSNSEIDLICDYATWKNKDDYENYIRKLKE